MIQVVDVPEQSQSRGARGGCNEKKDVISNSGGYLPGIGIDCLCLCQAGSGTVAGTYTSTRASEVAIRRTPGTFSPCAADM